MVHYIVLQYYEVIFSLSAAIHMTNPHYPNLQSISGKLSGGNSQLQHQLIQYDSACVQPAILYFKECLDGCMTDPLSAFKAAHLFSPQKISKMKPDSAVIDSLAVFPFLSAKSTLCSLKEELPEYVAKVEDVSPEYIQPNAILEG